MEIITILGAIFGTIIASLVGSGLLVALLNRKRDNNKEKRETEASEVNNAGKITEIALNLLPRLQDEINSLKQEIRELRVTVENHQVTITQQLHRIVQLQKTLESQSDTINNMQRAMREKDQQLLVKDEKMAAMAQQILERDEAIIHQQSEIHNLQMKVDQVEKNQKIQTGELRSLQNHA